MFLNNIKYIKIYLYINLMNYENLINLCKNNKNSKKIKNYYFDYKDNIDLHKDDNKLFKIIIKLGRIELFDFFYKMTKYENFIFKIDKKTLDIYDSESLLCYLCRYNHLEIIKYLFDNETTLDLYNKYNEPLVLSCQENNLDIVKYIYKYYENLDIFSDEVILTYSIFKRNYDISVWYLDVLFKSNIDKILKKQQLDYVLENICTIDSKLFEELIKKYDIKETDSILEKCLYYNNSDAIKQYLLDNYIFDKVVLERCYYHILKIKDLKIVKILDELNDDNEIIGWNELFMLSLSYNNIVLCDYIYKKHLMSSFNNILKLYDMSIFILCQEICNFDKLKVDGLYFIMNIIEENIEIDDIIKEKMIILFCSLNKLKEAKLIYKKYKLKRINIFNLNIKLERLLYCCNIKTIKWILQICELKMDDLDICEDTLLDIIFIMKHKKMNDNESVKLIRFIMYKKNMIKKFDLDDFVSMNNIYILKLLTKHKHFKTQETLFNICKYCDLDILKWYLKYSCIYNSNNLYICLKLCCKAGNYDMFLYLVENYNTDKIIYSNIEEIFSKACISNNIKLVIMLEKYVKKKIKIKHADGLVQHNCFNILRYLLDNPKLIINKNSMLKYSLKEGKIDVVRLLILNLNEKKIKEVIHLYEGSLLKLLLYNNSIDILILLDKYINNEVFNNIINKNVLDKLLNNENIEILKYINTGVDLKKYIYDDLFKNVCKLRKILSIKYLKELNNNYDYLKKNDEIIPIIKNSIEYYYENKNYEKLIEVLKIDIIENKGDDVNECYICYENKGLLKTKCNHNFCLDCILKCYIFIKKECPYCRNELYLNESKLLLE